jgi:uncharacterized delta-60 repeat protein
MFMSKLSQLKVFFISIISFLSYLTLFSTFSNAAIVAGGIDTTFLSNGGGLGASQVSTFSVQSDGSIIRTGNFAYFNGMASKYIARSDSLGNFDSNFDVGDSTGLNDGIYTVAVQSNGKVLLGGWFTSFNGLSRNKIVRLNSNGSVDTSFVVGTGFGTSCSGPDCYVTNIKVQSDGKILVAGHFSNYNGTAVSAFIRLNTDGTLDNTFNSGTGPNGDTSRIVLQSDGKILLRGSFTMYNGTARNGLARLNSDGSLDNTFNAGTGISTGIGDTIYSIAVQSDGKILIAGQFSSINGSSYSNIARLNSDGTVDTSFVIGAGANNYITSAVIQSDGKIVIGGYFTTFAGASRNRIARLNSNGSLDNTFDVGTGTNNTVSALAIQSNGNILVGGIFTQYKGVATSGEISLNSTGSIDSTYNPKGGADAAVNSVKIFPDDKIIIAGTFLTYKGISSPRLAKLNSDGSFDSSFNVGSGPNAALYSSALQTDGKVLIAGSFTNYNGTARNYVARINTDGSIDTGFVIGTGPNSAVSSVLVQPDGMILILGSFSSFNGTTRYGIARLNSNGSLDTGFVPGTVLNDYGMTMALQSDGKILLGYYNSSTYNSYVIRLNTNGSVDGSFTSTGAGNIYPHAIAVQSDGKVLVGGEYSTRIKRVNSDGTLDSSFNVGTGASAQVNTIAIRDNGRVVVGGTFWSYNGTNSNRIITLNTDGSIDSDFNIGTGANSAVNDIAIQSDGRILVAGGFTSYDGKGTNYFIRLGILTGFQISYLPVGVDAVTVQGSVKKGTALGFVNTVVPVTLEYNDLPVSALPVTFDNSSDRDWSAVSVDMNALTSQSVVSNLNPVDAPGAASTHSLYVAKLSGQVGVYVCPNATVLADLSESCSGGYYLAETASNISTVNIGGQDYWKIDGLTGTGALGLSVQPPVAGQPLVLTPNNSAVSITQEVTMDYASSLGFVSGDKVQFHFEPTAGFVLANTCATPTTDANGDSTVDGSGTIVGSDVYEYTFSDTVASSALSFCVNVTSPATAGSYSVRLTDDNGTFDSAMYYVGDDNDVFVIANVAPSLSFNIRTLADDADTNVCSFGTVSPSDAIPNYDNVDDGASECGYSLAVGTNAANGFQVQITADDQLNGTSGNIADLSNGGTFSAGVEAYGLANVTSSTSGRNVTTGDYTESILRDGNFALGASTGTNIPLSATNFVSYTNGIQYVAGVDSLDTTSVMHGLVIGSGTPAGYYDQVVTYTTTANF